MQTPNLGFFFEDKDKRGFPRYGGYGITSIQDFGENVNRMLEGASPSELTGAFADGRDGLEDVRDLGGVPFAAHPFSARPDLRWNGALSRWPGSSSRHKAAPAAPSGPASQIKSIPSMRFRCATTAPLRETPPLKTTGGWTGLPWTRASTM